MRIEKLFLHLYPFKFMIMKSILLLFICLLPVLAKSFQPGQKIKINDDIELIQIADGFFMHQTYVNSPEFGRFSSNGLLVIKKGKAFMIDTPVTNETTKRIAEFLKDSMNVHIKLFTGGHFHVDCIGGMEYLKSSGVKTFLNKRTKIKCIENNLPLPDTTFGENYFFNFEGIPVECRFVGGGHSSDNIIVCFPNQQILFGGCMVKSAIAPNLGNLQDAVVGEWKTSIQRIIGLYPSIKIVIPGHGDYGGIDLLYHTIELVEKFQKN
jgi:metallo-beta-lactamase class B